MELRQLRAFAAVAEEGSFHGGARRLNVAQPALWVAVRNLEVELCAALFVRGRRGVALTAEGESALIHARSALAEVEQLKSDVGASHAGEQGTIRLGFVGSATFRLIPAILPKFRHRFPQATFSLFESNTQEIVQGIAGKRLDVGLVRLPLLEAGPVRMMTLEQDSLSAALPVDHPLADHAFLDLALLKDCPFIMQSRISALHSLVLRACAEAGFIPDVAQEAIQLNTLLSLVGSGLGVALAPATCREQVPRTVNLIPLSRTIPTQLGMVAAREEDRKLVRNFWSLATELSRQTSVDTAPMGE